MTVQNLDPRWEPEEDFPYEDVRWRFKTDHAEPITLEVDSTSSNAYGPPIYLELSQGDQRVGIWLDLGTWQALYIAGRKAYDQRVQMTKDGWT